MNTQLMFPLNVQSKLAKLYIAQNAGKKANAIKKQVEAQVRELGKQAQTTVIELSSALEELRVSQLNELVEKLNKAGKQETAELDAVYNSIFSNVWNYNSGEYGSVYESIIEEANQEGANIYNATVSLRHKYSYEELDEVIERAVEKLGVENIKLKVRTKDLFDPSVKYEGFAPTRDIGKVMFYTTTKGARMISEIIDDVCYWDHISTEVHYYAMSMTTPAIEEVLGGEVKERRNDELDMHALVTVQARKASFDEEMAEMSRIITRNSKPHVNNERYNFVFNDEKDTPFFPLDEFAEMKDKLNLDESFIKAL